MHPGNLVSRQSREFSSKSGPRAHTRILLHCMPLSKTAAHDCVTPHIDGTSPSEHDHNPWRPELYQSGPPHYRDLVVLTDTHGVCNSVRAEKSTCRAQALRSSNGRVMQSRCICKLTLQQRQQRTNKYHKGSGGLSTTPQTL